jgi:hypothetical protein
MVNNLINTQCICMHLHSFEEPDTFKGKHAYWYEYRPTHEGLSGNVVVGSIPNTCSALNHGYQRIHMAHL